MLELAPGQGGDARRERIEERTREGRGCERFCTAVTRVSGSCTCSWILRSPSAERKIGAGVGERTEVRDQVGCFHRILQPSTMVSTPPGRSRRRVLTLERAIEPLVEPNHVGPPARLGLEPTRGQVLPTSPRRPEIAPSDLAVAAVLDPEGATRVRDGPVGEDEEIERHVSRVYPTRSCPVPGRVDADTHCPEQAISSSMTTTSSCTSRPST